MWLCSQFANSQASTPLVAGCSLPVRVFASARLDAPVLGIMTNIHAGNQQLSAVSRILHRRDGSWRHWHKQSRNRSHRHDIGHRTLLSAAFYLAGSLAGCAPESPTSADLAITDVTLIDAVNPRGAIKPC